MSATPPSPDICLIVVNGSEFAMKAMAALEAAKDKLPAQYSIKQVALLKLKKIARPPHLVPIMSVDDKVIADSTDIVKFLDEHYGTDFFPKGEIGKKVAELEEESDTVLSVFLRYFAFYDNDGFSRGIKKQARAASTLFPRPTCLCCPVADRPCDGVPLSPLTSPADH